jgi:uncharacterized low-complexity protein
MEFIMTRILSVAAALSSAVLFVSATASIAQTGAYYSATPATAPTKASVITQGTLWKCTDGVCTAKKSTQRDSIMCELVAKQVGTLTTFTVAGAPLDADALAKCNARAS